VLAEVQQTSDLTYRVYDYNRLGADGKPRELHVAKSLDVIDFSIDECSNIEGTKVDIADGVSVNHKIKNKYFAVEIIDIDEGVYADNADGTHFIIYTAIKGNGSIIYNDNKLPLSMGETVLIPADMGKFKIEGNIKLIKSYVPDLK
jgi:mannose-6-phosphate isomerase